MLNRIEIGVLVAAMALHGGGLAYARMVPSLKTAKPAFTEVMELELVEIPTLRLHETKVEPRVVDPEQEPEQQPAIATNVETDAPRKGRGVNVENGGDKSDGSSTGPGEVMTGTGEPGEEDWSAGPEPGGPGVGPGRTGISALVQSIAMANAKAQAAPTETPKAKKADREAATRVIKEELRNKDKRLGLDLPAAGTIASLIKNAMQASDAPTPANASFQVVLGPGGKVQSVKVLSFSAGAASTYEGIARNVKSALAAQKLNLTEDYKKGAVVVVNANAKMQMPSGAEPGAGIKLSLTQNFDVADIGASPVRVVKVSFSSKPVE